ncbi:MAG: M28 family peptidase, partial [Anaerolineae bacterium]|nr:M28 family peptidase [Anaerolineae bacterium]
GWPWSVGARHLADTLTDPPAFVIVVDMVGDTDQQLYWEVSSTPWLRQRLWSLAEELGYGQFFTPSEKHHLADDHTPFLERGIPAVDIIDFDYPPWHTTADTPDRVSAASLERVGRVVECLLEDCRPAP